MNKASALWKILFKAAIIEITILLNSSIKKKKLNGVNNEIIFNSF